MLAHVPVAVEVLRSSAVADMNFTKVEQADELILLAWKAAPTSPAYLALGRGRAHRASA
jgi:hypothetical protein